MSFLYFTALGLSVLGMFLLSFGMYINLEDMSVLDFFFGVAIFLLNFFFFHLLMRDFPEVLKEWWRGKER